ncbi:MAG: hypothetical protein OEV49_15245 [candidate division Zixibacteria bacterium]|nr:hypothetical protein [candidate division Zixibacteria bacterium]MDH3936453.1 hypothetical protein [candidate division Zixibacteria bacterium]MDH4033098.1 hypothetical protein [candidate division Zixibacteria bacterium]
MFDQLRTVVTFILLLIVLPVNYVTARSVARDARYGQSKALLGDDDGPASCAAYHDVGKLKLAISNTGNPGGFNWGHSGCFEFINPDAPRWTCEYPKNTGLEHLWNTGLWVGAIVGNDTLVSTGDAEWWLQREFAPDFAPEGDMVRRSILDPESPEYEGARSEQDFIAVYYDTLKSLHNTLNWGYEYSKPIGLKVTQKSYSWSYKYAEDFVLFDLTIKNMDYRPLRDVYIGLFVAPTVGYAGGGVWGWADDICGFLRTYPSHRGCDFEDTLNLAWAADADGDWYDYVGPRRWLHRLEQVWLPLYPTDGYGRTRSIFSVAAAEILQAPGADWDVSFNWWTRRWGTDQRIDFGPQTRDHYRVFESGAIGAPHTDPEKYFVMSNEEIDYDQAHIGRISPANPTWSYPGKDVADTVARGGGTTYLLSYGPFQLGPYASVPLSFAHVLGEHLHSELFNLDNLPDRPHAYYSNLNFSDLARNATWARWVYDNPGYDTDDDGYRGVFRVCPVESTLTDSGWLLTEADTFWYRGDGVPDFRGASPPPAPDVWVTPTVGGLHVRINGQRSETEKDVFSGISDFEGYHIYIGRDNRKASFSLVASYDRENFDRYVWDNDHVDAEGWPEPGFALLDVPFTLRELRCLYGGGSDPCEDTSFHPLHYPHSRPFFHPLFGDSVFYFVPHDFNTYEGGETTPIRKRFPLAADPRGIPVDELTEEYYTEDGYLKYFEYEFTIENLLPTVPYWVSVTAFDFGSPTGGVDALETSITDVTVQAYPINSEAEATGAYTDVYVYPNPYIKDAGYRNDGYELRTRTDLPNYRVHTIHFTNLPPKCTIRIHTPDGDLVREIRHNVDPADPVARDHDWHLVTQNHQLVVSGWYYWTVESPDGRVQIGKLVILL